MEVPILKASARIAARLNYLCPQFFPAPGFGSLRHNHVKDHRASNEVCFATFVMKLINYKFFFFLKYLMS